MTAKIAAFVDQKDHHAVQAWSWGVEAQVFKLSSQDEILDALHQVVEQRIKVVAVQGSDAFLALVLTCWSRHFVGQEHPVRFFPLPVPHVECLVATQLGKNENLERRVKKLVKKAKKNALQDLDSQRISAMRVSNSVEDGATYAFSLALGWFYDLWLASKKGGFSGAAKLATMGVDAAKRIRDARAGVASQSGESSEQVLVMKDRTEAGTAPFGLLCSSLESTLFDIHLSGGESMDLLQVDDEKQALAVMARSKAPLTVLKGSHGARVKTLHIDGLTRCVVDGQEVEMKPAGILSVSQGSSFELLY